jgi:hypothetical protein
MRTTSVPRRVRTRFDGRRRERDFGQAKKAYQSARHREQSVRICIVCFNGLFVLQNRCARIQKSRAARCRSVPSRSNWLNEFLANSGMQSACFGAGETSERTARALVSRGVTDLRVSNRSLDRARELAQAVGGRPCHFDQWPRNVGDRHSDYIYSIGSSVADIRATRADVGSASDRPLFIIDIAVPRDVDPSVNELEGVYLYDIDSIRSVAEQSLASAGNRWLRPKRSLPSMSQISSRKFRGNWVAFRKTRGIRRLLTVRCAHRSHRAPDASPALHRRLHFCDDKKNHPGHARQ